MTKINVMSYGCSANTADAEIIRGLLQEDGFNITHSTRNSDLNIILTCIVKTPTEHKITKRVSKLAKSGTPLIVAGCMPKAMKEHVEKIAPRASMVGPDDILMINEAVNETLRGVKLEYTCGGPTDRTCLPRIRENNKEVKGVQTKI